MPPDKRALIDAAVVALSRELATLTQAANDARAAATHEEARPENDKDTRAVEASYLARGQAARVAELGDAVQALRFLELLTFDDGTPVALSALVELDVDGARSFVLVVPACGGVRVDHGGRAVQLVTPHAPLGRALVGKRAGDAVELAVRGVTREYEIVAVS